jgi:hypothetical protein
MEIVIPLFTSQTKVINMTENIDLLIEIALYLISFGFKVYVNRRNDWGIPVFHVTGSAGSKPEVIATSKKYERLAHTSSLLDGIPTTLPTVFAIELKTRKKYFPEVAAA